MDKLPPMPRAPSMDKLPRVPSTRQALTDPIDLGSATLSSRRQRLGPASAAFPASSNLSGLAPSASYDKLSSLGSGGGLYRPGFPRNSSIEDILSLVASSEHHNGSSMTGSSLQLSAAGCSRQRIGARSAGAATTTAAAEATACG
ncbi:hypothetical protein PINS_up016002 [Pythium insidiosum]|nr:hypothetical protein PINS_up016002 [Pythium insidiosum]